jgi:ATP-dependent helicase YprA (DUF1998 family)
MTDRFDPLATSQLIIEGYRRYLRSLLPVRDPKIATALDYQITNSGLLTKGPLLEATPPYEHGATLDTLIREGVLSPAMKKLGSENLPLTRPLYVHQELAIRKVAAGRNVVVATGTGSGKTESFLFPILNELSAEYERNGHLKPGVRALLLYPMNALANDQMKRLRQILKAAPHITFGRYVGDTKESEQQAEETFGKLNPGEERLPNELISRRAMRETPPHLLLTNYAMLEYLLLRPADMDLFEGSSAGRWRFLVLDEAHVYDGARAAEVAMLLRRLRDRVACDRPLRYIATSATVGDKEEDIMEFAQRLFDAPFEWIPDDSRRQDLVRASRKELPKPPFWGPLDPAAYIKIANTDDPAKELLRRAPIEGDANGEGLAGAILAKEANMAQLRELLAAKPQMSDALADKLFGQEGTKQERRRYLDALVTAGSRITGLDGLAVLSARYHLFVRATEGAYTCLSETGPHVTLARHESCPECRAVSFEFGACKRCGSLHVSGTVNGDSGILTLGSYVPGKPHTWLLIGDGINVIDEDDATLEDKPDNLDSKDAVLCAECGGIYDGSRKSCGRAECGSARLLRVRKLNTAKDTITGCLVCGGRGSAMVRGFQSGGDAAASVLSTSLYQALPPAPDPVQADQPGEGRKLLLFSDSRQAAAFFAPYLETSYETIQHRRLILEGLARAVEDEDEGATVSDLAYHVAKAAGKAHVFPRKMSAQERRREAALWVMQELVTIEDRQSLEGRGLMRVSLDRQKSWQLPKGLTTLGLSETEVWDLLAELVRSVRQQGAITMPEGVEANDEGFDPRRGPIYVRSTGPEPKRKVISWLPGSGVNRRLDYVRRVVDALGSTVKPEVVLDGCWKFLMSLRDGWLSSENVSRVGVVHQIDHTWLRLEPVGAEDPLFECDRCRRQSPRSVRDICTTLGCSGRLMPASSVDDDHYRFLYRNLNPVPMQAREHTAQLTSDEAADVQQQFVRGEVNALSCSTTFELGVDVGELQSVVMRNMPPTTANYVQRAGRAGRRTDSAALVLTYAQRRSHDLSRFQQPEVMVAGEVRSPYVPLGNKRIDRRHAHSVALAAFFRWQRETTGETWSTAGDFFLGDSAPVSRVQPYLWPVVPEGIAESLRRVLPPDVQTQIGIETGAWAEALCDQLEGVRVELAEDVAQFAERRQQAFDVGKDTQAAMYGRTIATLKDRPLIGLLANRNVLPKYGFPTDTVELRTVYSGDPMGRKLELSRDLSAAIYEYAPGAEIVAGGRLWTSGGVYRLPGKELLGNFYVVCQECSLYRESKDDDIDPVCPSCGTTVKGAKRSYRTPLFGFVALQNPRKPGMVAPQRSWHGATYVLSQGADEFENAWSLANGVTADTWAGERGELIAISEGRNGAGFRICEWCGWGTAAGGKVPESHPHLVKDGADCSGPLAWHSLAHRYETDLLEVTFSSGQGLPGMTVGEWRSVLYALLEGASDSLNISRDDIDGTLYPKPGRNISLVLFDTVPGGAGGALRIAKSFDIVLKAALARMDGCECGPETSCYGCLRNFRNQPYHDQLRRGDALTFLARDSSKS